LIAPTIASELKQRIDDFSSVVHPERRTSSPTDVTQLRTDGQTSPPRALGEPAGWIDHNGWIPISMSIGVLYEKEQSFMGTTCLCWLGR
jgi:hypothetical protein